MYRRLKYKAGFVIMFVLWVGMAASCSPLSNLASFFEKDSFEFRGSGNSPLSAISLHETGVVLDIYVIRVPYDHRELLAQFWDDVDENELSPEIRKELHNHGLRQGMLSPKVPVSLARLIEQQETGSKPFEVAMTKNQPLIFPTRSAIASLPVLAVVDGKPTGQVYHNAKGVILITTEELPDGSVKLKTVPEIYYGDETGKITSNGGVYTRQTTIPKLPFDQLAVETKLLLGQWVVIGPDLRKEGGFGRDILTQGNSNPPEQLLIAIRLKQTKKDGIHDRNDIALSGVKRPEDDFRINHDFDDDHSAFSAASEEEIAKGAAGMDR